jgi:hypothetical protein
MLLTNEINNNNNTGPTIKLRDKISHMVRLVVHDEHGEMQWLQRLLTIEQ